MICSHAGEVAAYLDGELTAPAENSFETHLNECAECSERLNVQKRLLCALDIAFEGEKSFDLPANFAKSIAARAESDLSGLRSKEEWRRALLITSGLFAIGVAVGMAGKQSRVITFVIEKLFAKIWVIAAISGNFCYDFLVGFNVVLRIVGRSLLIESPLAAFLLTVLLVVAFVILSRLLFKFHRIEHSG